ncbi:MAG: glycosyltransferase family 2 protein [Candidatus Heimdallarchaeota archaeon]
MGFILESIYLVLILACLIYFIVIFIYSTNGWQILELEEGNLPFVSIIVPTLEEEGNIGKCLESLTHLDYSNKEIIVVDGGSKDKTVEIARKFGVNVVVDENLPEGWIGKSYGCNIGYQAAKGDILLFTDADSNHSVDSLRIAVGHTLGVNAKLFSIFPYQKAERWYEHLIGFMYFLSFIAGGPRNDINNPYNKDSFIASGQYMMFTREGYNEIGGHMAVSTSLVEDVALAKLCKEKELRLNFIDGTKLVTTRMYPDKFADFFRGFRRMIWGGLNTLTPWRILFVIFWLIYVILAPISLVRSIVNTPNWMWWDYSVGLIINAFAYFAWGFCYYIYWRKRGKGNFFFYIFWPIPMLLNIVVVLVAVYYGLAGKKISWKTKHYSSDKQKLIKGISSKETKRAEALKKKQTFKQKT